MYLQYLLSLSSVFLISWSACATPPMLHDEGEPTRPSTTAKKPTLPKDQEELSPETLKHIEYLNTIAPNLRKSLELVYELVCGKTREKMLRTHRRKPPIAKIEEKSKKESPISSPRSSNIELKERTDFKDSLDVEMGIWSYFFKEIKQELASNPPKNSEILATVRELELFCTDVIRIHGQIKSPRPTNVTQVKNPLIQRTEDGTIILSSKKPSLAQAQPGTTDYDAVIAELRGRQEKIATNVIKLAKSPTGLDTLSEEDVTTTSMSPPPLRKRSKSTPTLPHSSLSPRKVSLSIISRKKPSDGEKHSSKGSPKEKLMRKVRGGFATLRDKGSQAPKD